MTASGFARDKLLGSAPRISDEQWEKHRAVILEKYLGSMTLTELMRYMKEEYNFSATKRQYVHRLLKVWSVTKYKIHNTSSTLHVRAQKKQDDSPVEPGTTAPDKPKPTDTPMPPAHHEADLSPASSPTCPSSAQTPQRPKPSSSSIDPIGPVLARPGLGRRTPLPSHRSQPVHNVDDFALQPNTFGKRPRDEESDSEQIVRYSCPFRKRNPLRFNVYSHQSCATQAFPDISQLKRHVKNFHRSEAARGGSRCPRCKAWMATMEEYNEHLTVPADQICEAVTVVPPTDPEDGISAQVEDVLNARKLDNKIVDWERLWGLLFPQDNEIPTPDFEPPVEHFELREFLETRFPRQLAAILGTELGITVPETELIGKVREAVDWILDSFQQNRIRPLRRKLRTRSIERSPYRRPGPY
ncbi:hypothetical protein VTK26DRAFT_7036 [Humicola hyalothermophila]